VFYFVKRVRSLLCRMRGWCDISLHNLQPGVNIGKVMIMGSPQISVCAGGFLEIEDGVILRSSNRGYHVNLFAPVKLQVSYPGSKIRIGVRSRVYGSSLNAYNSIEIGQDCLIAGNCQIMDANGHYPHFDCLEKRAASKDKGRPVVLEDYVWLGTGCIVLPGVRIGRGSIVGAGSVVAQDIPPLCVAAGNPAKVVRRFNDLGVRISLEKESI
jgi:acetyltransferase-like isoleucine patch superfamily enzyme